MNEFTRGPWTAEFFVDHAMIKSKKKYIGHVYTKGLVSNNVDLVCAAPDLYQACLEAWFHVKDQKGYVKENLEEMLWEALEKANPEFDEEFEDHDEGPDDQTIGDMKFHEARDEGRI